MALVGFSSYIAAENETPRSIARCVPPCDETSNLAQAVRGSAGQANSVAPAPRGLQKARVRECVGAGMRQSTVH
jgi:hypothetical protein